MEKNIQSLFGLRLGSIVVTVGYLGLVDVLEQQMIIIIAGNVLLTLKIVQVLE